MDDQQQEAHIVELIKQRAADAEKIKRLEWIVFSLLGSAAIGLVSLVFKLIQKAGE